MTNYDYLIIGGGMTAAAAVDGIREVDANGGIGMISTEPDAPYNRPPLSKALWKGKPLDSIWRKTENKGVEMHLGRVVKQIVPNEKRVVADKGDVFTYEKLLLSTGGRPRRLAFDDDQIIYFRTLSDYRRLRELTATSRRFAVIGGGFIGSEIAAALAMNREGSCDDLPGQDIGERVFPRDLSQYVSSFYKQKGVELLAGEKIVALEARGDQHLLKTATRARNRRRWRGGGNRSGAEYRTCPVSGAKDGQRNRSGRVPSHPPTRHLCSRRCGRILQSCS